MSSDGIGVLSPALTGTGGDIEKAGKDGIGITWQNRPPASKLQWFCLVIYFAIGGLFIVQGSLAVSQQNIQIMHPGQECSGNWWRRTDMFQSHWCLAPELKEPWDKCMAKLAPYDTALGQEERQAEKREEQDEEVKREDMFSLLGSNGAVTATMFPSIIIVAIAWFFLLKNFPLVVVYGTIGVGVVLQVALGIMNINEHPEKSVNAGVGNFILAAIVIVITWLLRRQITFVCRTCAAACKILKLRLSIFAASFVLKLVWAGLISLAIWFLTSATLQVKVVEGPFNCAMALSAVQYQYGPMLAFLWISVFMDMALALVTAVGIGAFFFHRDDPTAPQYPAFTALGWAFSSSTGAIAESSVLVVLIKWAEQYFDFKHGYAFFCVCNPVWWVFKFIWMCFANILSTLSRFLVIMHGFHGGDFSTEDPKRPSKELLLKHLGTGFVNGIVGQEVLSFSASILATCIGLATHCWLDATEKIHMFSTYPVLFKTIPLLYLIFSDSFYKCGLALVVMLNIFYEGLFHYAMPKELSCALAGLFICFVSKIIFQFFVDVVFHATDGLLYCYVLQAESGNPVSEDMKEIVGIIEDSKGNESLLQQKAEEGTDAPYGSTSEEKGTAAPYGSTSEEKA